MQKAGLHQTIGIDISPNQLKKAQEADPQSFYVCAKAEHLPFQNRTFHVVTAFESFHWFTNPDAINEIARVLKEGGFFFVINRKLDVDSPLFHADKIVSGFGIDFEHPAKHYNPIGSLQSQGFKKISSTVFSDPIELSSSEKVLALLQSRGIWSLVLENPRKKEIEEKVKEFVEGLFAKNQVKTLNLNVSSCCIVADKPSQDPFTFKKS